jgi:hypothetical protein
MQPSKQPTDETTVRRVLSLPHTRWGWEALALLGLHIASMIFAMLMVATGQQGGETFFDNLWISVPMFIAGGAAIAAGALAVASIIFRGERSLFVFAALLLGLFVAWFAIGEVVSPH